MASLVALLLQVILTALSVFGSVEVEKQQHNGLNVIVLGNSATFTCVSNSSIGVMWSFYRGHKHIYVDDNSYPIKKNITGRHLILENVTASAAGRYVCVDNGGTGPTLLDVDLVVLLDPDMSCSTNASVDGVVVEHDVVEYACELCYGGTAKPVFRWTDRDGNPVTSGMSVVPKNEVSCLRSNVTVTAGTEKLGQVTCDVSFSLRTSTNRTPSVRRRTFDKLPVQFPVRNVVVTNATTSRVLHIHRWQTLVCSADGQPEVEYRWTDVTSGRQTDGDVLVLNDTGMHEYQCSAWNVVRNVMYNVSCYVSVNVVEEQDPVMGKALESMNGDQMQQNNVIVLGIVGIVCGLLLLVVVLVVLKKRRHHHREPQWTQIVDRQDIVMSSSLVGQDTMMNCVVYEEIGACKHPISHEVAWESHSKTDNVHGNIGILKDTPGYLTVQIPSHSSTQGVQYTHEATGCHDPSGWSFDGRYFVERNASRETQPCYYGNVLYGEDTREMDRQDELDEGVYLHTL